MKRIIEGLIVGAIFGGIAYGVIVGLRWLANNVSLEVFIFMAFWVIGFIGYLVGSTDEAKQRFKS